MGSFSLLPLFSFQFLLLLDLQGKAKWVRSPFSLFSFQVLLLDLQDKARVRVFLEGGREGAMVLKRNAPWF